MYISQKKFYLGESLSTINYIFNTTFSKKDVWTGRDLNPWSPPCEKQKAGQNDPFFQYRSLKKYYLQNRSLYIDYLDNIRQVQPKQSKDYTHSLDKKLSHIKTIMDLKKNLEKNYTDPYGKALKNLFNFMEYQEIEEFNGISTEKWKKKIKLKISGVREIYIPDSELKEAYQKVENRFKSLFKLLVFSGMRLTQLLEGIKNLENIVIKGKIARIPISSLSKGKKKGFWIYFPTQFLPELKMLETKYCYYTYAEKIKNNRVSANTIRKWNYNFLIENRVPESIADFIQGRSSTSVGSAHYLNKTMQADREYEIIVEKLLNIFS